MPCSDDRDSYSESERLSSAQKELSALNKENKSLKNKNNNLEAILCALTTELRKDPAHLKIIADAEVNGQVLIQKWILKHSQEDRVKLNGSLDEYSEHEQRALREILNAKYPND